MTYSLLSAKKSVDKLIKQFDQSTLFSNTELIQQNSHRPWWFYLLIASVYQCSWLLLLIYGNRFIPLVSAFVILYLILEPRHKRNLFWLTVISLSGIILDTFWHQAGVMIYSHEGFFPPPWLLMIWPVFAIMVISCLRWLIKKPAIFAVVASFSAPFTYWGGSQLAGVEFGFSLPLSLGLLSIGWFILSFIWLSINKSIASSHWAI